VKKRVLIVGCGKIGTVVARNLSHSGCRVDGIRRFPPPNANEPFTYLAADITRPVSLAGLKKHYDLAIVILTPSERSEWGYRQIFQFGVSNLLTHFEHSNLHPPCIFVSSSSVYGQNRGQWVDENSPTRPESYRGQYLLLAEKMITDFHPASIIIRFSGIYGAGRNRLIRQLERGGAIQKDPPLYTNRIHQDDCADVLTFIAQNRLRSTPMHSLYLASDDLPVDKWSLMHWLAEQTKQIKPVPLCLGANAPQNKRCNNRRLRELGYHFTYPSYMSGYCKIPASLSNSE